MRIFLGLICFLVLSNPVFSAGNAAEKYVNDVAQEAFSIIGEARAKKIANTEAKAKFRKILNNSFDVSAIARSALGRYWRVATPAEKAEYTKLLETVILSTYADRMLGYSGNGYKITGSRALSDRVDEVSMTLISDDRTPVAFNWIVRKGDNGLRIIDLSVEGVSMVATHRTDFGAVIERNGGKVQALIDALKQKKVASAKP